MIVGARHAENVAIRRYNNWFIIFLARAPIIWHYKKHNMVKLEALGTEFIALKQAIESHRSVVYNLCILFIELIGKPILLGKIFQ